MSEKKIKNISSNQENTFNRNFSFMFWDCDWSPKIKLAKFNNIFKKWEVCPVIVLVCHLRKKTALS